MYWVEIFTTTFKNKKYEFSPGLHLLWHPSSSDLTVPRPWTRALRTSVVATGEANRQRPCMFYIFFWIEFHKQTSGVLLDQWFVVFLWDPWAQWKKSFQPSADGLGCFILKRKWWLEISSMDFGGLRDFQTHPYFCCPPISWFIISYFVICLDKLP